MEKLVLPPAKFNSRRALRGGGENLQGNRLNWKVTIGKNFLGKEGRVKNVLEGDLGELLP